MPHVCLIFALLGGRGDGVRVEKRRELLPDDGGGGRTSQFSRIHSRKDRSLVYRVVFHTILRRGGGGTITNDDFVQLFFYKLKMLAV